MKTNTNTYIIRATLCNHLIKHFHHNTLPPLHSKSFAVLQALQRQGCCLFQLEFNRLHFIFTSLKTYYQEIMDRILSSKGCDLFDVERNSDTLLHVWWNVNTFTLTNLYHCVSNHRFKQ